MNRKPMKVDVSGLRETPRNIRSYRKESGGLYRELVALDPATGYPVVTARVYFPGSVAYCCLWVTNRSDRYGRGCGKAGGGGYHKPSAALADAIHDAGIRLSESINGVGDSAMESAVLAIARAVTGKRRFILHTAHA